jgi:hypothetical protein
MTDTQNKEPQMDAWAMATSILVGLTKAEATAEAELAQRRANANQNPFGAGVKAISFWQPPNVPNTP